MAGICYLVNSFASFTAPGLPVFPCILFSCLIGESAVGLGLLIVGVDEAKYDTASAAPRP